MTSKTIATICAAFVALGPALATAESGVEVGVMTCKLEGGSNVIVYSDAKYSCKLDASNDRLNDGLYEAKIKRIGVNLEWKSKETLVWGVFALSDKIDNGPIAGSYVGAGADASLGIGGGANVLVGGLDSSFALQPLSVSGSKGVGASVGVEELNLNFKGEIAK